MGNNSIKLITLNTKHTYNILLPIKWEVYLSNYKMCCATQSKERMIILRCNLQHFQVELAGDILEQHIWTGRLTYALQYTSTALPPLQRVNH